MYRSGRLVRAQYPQSRAPRWFAVVLLLVVTLAETSCSRPSMELHRREIEDWHCPVIGDQVPELIRYVDVDPCGMWVSAATDGRVYLLSAATGALRACLAPARGAETIRGAVVGCDGAFVALMARDVDGAPYIAVGSAESRGGWTERCVLDGSALSFWPSAHWADDLGVVTGGGLVVPLRRHDGGPPRRDGEAWVLPIERAAAVACNGQPYCRTAVPSLRSWAEVRRPHGLYLVDAVHPGGALIGHPEGTVVDLVGDAAGPAVALWSRSSIGETVQVYSELDAVRDGTGAATSTRWSVAPLLGDGWVGSVRPQVAGSGSRVAVMLVRDTCSTVEEPAKEGAGGTRVCPGGRTYDARLAVLDRSGQVLWEMTRRNQAAAAEGAGWCLFPDGRSVVLATEQPGAEGGGRAVLERWSEPGRLEWSSGL